MKTMWVAMLAVWMGAVTGWGESQLIQHKGECTVQDVDAFKTDKHVKISYGEDVTFECGVFATEMMGEYRLRATPVVKNNTDGPVKVWYFLAFFDADGIARFELCLSHFLAPVNLSSRRTFASCCHSLNVIRSQVKQVVWNPQETPMRITQSENSQDGCRIGAAPVRMWRAPL